MPENLADDLEVDFKELDKDNEPFLQALHKMEHSTQSLFITGKAGTGKSTLVKLFKENTRKSLIILAPTGIAAINVGGQTIHR